MGEAAYRAAREHAWRTAAHTGRASADQGPSPEAAHELAEWIWDDAALSDAERLTLMLPRPRLTGVGEPMIAAEPQQPAGEFEQPQVVLGLLLPAD